MLGFALQIFSSFIAALGFGMMFKMPKKLLLYAGFGGTLVWAVYLLIIRFTFFGIVEASFFATTVASIFSTIFANLKKTPRTTFLIPSIVFLLPGSGIYYTMIGVIENDMNAIFRHGFDTIKIALAISIAIATVFVLPNIFVGKKKNS